MFYFYLIYQPFVSLELSLFSNSLSRHTKVRYRRGIVCRLRVTSSSYYTSVSSTEPKGNTAGVRRNFSEPSQSHRWPAKITKPIFFFLTIIFSNFKIIANYLYYYIITRFLWSSLSRCWGRLTLSGPTRANDLSVAVAPENYCFARWWKNNNNNKSRTALKTRTYSLQRDPYKQTVTVSFHCSLSSGVGDVEIRLLHST